MEILLVCVPNHLNLSPQLVGMRVFTSFILLLNRVVMMLLFFYLFEGRKRLNRLCCAFADTGLVPKDTRGGSHQSNEQKAVSVSIRNFMSSLHPVPSHYGRKKSARLYLSLLLSIRKLWKAWRQEYSKENANQRPFTYKRFRKIFTTQFNISFGLPRTDLCSTCCKLENEKKVKETAEEATVQLDLHML